MNAATRVRLRPLVIRPEDGQYVVGSLHNGEFVAIPEVGKRAIELLQGENTFEQVGRRLGEEFGGEVDLADFVDQLRELGFVQAIDGRPVNGGVPAFRPNLPRLRSQHVRWLFSWPFRLLYLAIVAVAAVALATRSGPSWFRYDTLLWLDYTSLVMVANIVMIFVMAALHELAHLVAARSLGLPARVTLSTRLTALVAVTDVRCMWAVAPRRRYRVYLAGMANDLLVISVAQILAAAVPASRAPMDALSLLTILAMLNQLQLYMRTDLYLVATTLAKTKNLYQDASVYLLDRLRRVWHRVAGRAPTRSDPLAGLSTRELAMARGYSVFMVVGSVIAIGSSVTVVVPTLVATVWRGVVSVRNGDLVSVIDGTVTLAAAAALQVLFLTALLRGRRERLRRLRERLR